MKKYTPEQIVAKLRQADRELSKGLTVKEIYLTIEVARHFTGHRVVEALADLEIRGEVEVLADEPACKQWIKGIHAHLTDARGRFEDLVGTRTGMQALREATTGLLMQWFLHGRQ